MKKNVVLLAVVLAILMPTVSYSEEDKADDAKLNTIGVSVSSIFVPIPIFFTVRGTYTPIKNTFIELGMDMGWGYDPNFWSVDDELKIFLYPFANYALYLPFPRTKNGKRVGGWYVGAGLGVWCAYWEFNDVGSTWDAAVAMNIITGFNLWFIDFSYTLQTDFRMANHKLSVGYVYRFK